MTSRQLETLGVIVVEWALVGAPLDCSGTNRGEARAPVALREAGLADVLAARDAGDVEATVDDPNRDPETGVIGFGQIAEASTKIRSAMGEILERGERPLVVGGDCTILNRDPSCEGATRAHGASIPRRPRRLLRRLDLTFGALANGVDQLRALDYG
jgi:arginase family enzyme